MQVDLKFSSYFKFLVNLDNDFVDALPQNQTVVGIMLDCWTLD